LTLPYQFHAVRQPPKTPDRGCRGLTVEGHCFGYRQRGQHVYDIVASRQGDFALSQQGFITPHQPVLSVDTGDAVVLIPGRATAAETHLPDGLGHQAPQACVVAIDHRDFSVLEDAGLCPYVFWQSRIAVHVVFTDVQDRSRARPQTGRGLELKARQFQHVAIRLAVLLRQQFKYRHADIASHRAADMLRRQQRPHQGGHRALAVGARNGQYRCLHVTQEQFHVAQDIRAPGRRARDDRLRNRDPGTHHDQFRIGETFVTEGPRGHLDPGMVLAQALQQRGLITGICHAHRITSLQQVLHAAETRPPETDDQCSRLQAHHLYRHFIDTQCRSSHVSLIVS
jgi:hypothetical protein